MKDKEQEREPLTRDQTDSIRRQDEGLEALRKFSNDFKLEASRSVLKELQESGLLSDKVKRAIEVVEQAAEVRGMKAGIEFAKNIKGEGPYSGRLIEMLVRTYIPDEQGDSTRLFAIKVRGKERIDNSGVVDEVLPSYLVSIDDLPDGHPALDFD